METWRINANGSGCGEGDEIMWPFGKACSHKWVSIKEEAIYKQGNYLRLRCGVCYHLRCEKCGDMKKRDISV